MNSQVTHRNIGCQFSVVNYTVSKELLYTKPYMKGEMVENQVRVFIVVLRGYMWFSESSTNLITGFNKCKFLGENIFIKIMIR